MKKRSRKATGKKARITGKQKSARRKNIAIARKSKKKGARKGGGTAKLRKKKAGGISKSTKKRDLLRLDRIHKADKMGSPRHKRLKSYAKKGWAKKTSKVFGEKYERFTLTDKGFRHLNTLY